MGVEAGDAHWEGLHSSFRYVALILCSVSKQYYAFKDIILRILSRRDDNENRKGLRQKNNTISDIMMKNYQISRFL